MYDQLIKGAIGVAVAAVAYIAADKAVEKRTGKHIHQHVLLFVQNLRTKAKQWLDGHPKFQRVYTDTEVFADRITSAAKRKWNKVSIPVFGKHTKSGMGVIIKELEEEVDLSDATEILNQFKTNPVLC